MSFTDDDLKRLKDGLEECYGWEAFNFNCELTPKDIKALLARLDAAEDLILHHTITPIGYDHRYEVWRKAAGK